MSVSSNRSSRCTTSGERNTKRNSSNRKTPPSNGAEPKRNSKQNICGPSPPRKSPSTAANHGKSKTPPQNDCMDKKPGTVGSKKLTCKPGIITRNPFFNFLRTIRIRHCDWSVVKVAVEGARLWLCMTDEQKQRFRSEACEAPKIKRKMRKSRLKQVKQLSDKTVLKNRVRHQLRKTKMGVKSLRDIKYKTKGLGKKRRLKQLQAVKIMKKIQKKRNQKLCGQPRKIVRRKKC